MSFETYDKDMHARFYFVDVLQLLDLVGEQARWYYKYYVVDAARRKLEER